MNETRYAAKVGLFVAIGLLLLGALLFSFSKGMAFFTPSYELNLEAKSVSGLKNNADVMLSGVPVGKVTGFDLTSSGKAVIIHLELEKKYQDRIHEDAFFSVQQQGLLGDQYVEITPRENKAPPVPAGATVQAEAPLSIQETARSAKDLIQLASETLTSLNKVMGRIDRTLLSERGLTNIAGALDNFALISERASHLINNLDKLVQTNTPPIALSISNLASFSREMEKLAAQMNQIVATNRVELNKAVKNLEATSHVLQNLANDVEEGKGLAGLLIKDQQFRRDISNVASNFQVFSQNLNEHGLLHNLFFKPKVPNPPEPEAPPAGRNGVTPRTYPGKDPFE